VSRTNWKGFERFIARALGVERYSKSHLGEKAPDVIKELGDYLLVIECRNRKNINLSKEIEDAESHRMDHRDIVALCFRKTNSKKIDVYMKIKDFEKFYQNVFRTQKSYLQSQEMVVRLNWENFLWMIKIGVKSKKDAINYSHKRSKKK